MPLSTYYSLVCELQSHALCDPKRNHAEKNLNRNTVYYIVVRSHPACYRNQAQLVWKLCVELHFGGERLKWKESTIV